MINLDNESAIESSQHSKLAMQMAFIQAIFITKVFIKKNTLSQKNVLILIKDKIGG